MGDYALLHGDCTGYHDEGDDVSDRPPLPPNPGSPNPNRTLLKARIAELEEQNNRVVCDNQRIIQDWRQTDAELVALRDRRCEECASWHGHNYCAEGIGEEADVPELPGPDFACNRWQPRE